MTRSSKPKMPRRPATAAKLQAVLDSMGSARTAADTLSTVVERNGAVELGHAAAELVAALERSASTLRTIQARLQPS